MIVKLPCSWLFSKGFIFGCFKEAFLFKNKFPQVKIMCFHVIERCVSARLFFTSLSSVLLIIVEQYHYYINSQ